MIDLMYFLLIGNESNLTYIPPMFKTIALTIAFILVCLFVLVMIVFNYFYGGRLAPDQIAKKHKRSKNKDKVIKEKCERDIAEIKLDKLVELRNACEWQLKDLQEPGNRSEVVLPISISTASFMISLTAFLKDSLNPYINIAVCICILILLEGTLHITKKIKKKQKVLSFYIELIDERLKKQQDEQVYIVTVRDTAITPHGGR